jgi:ubiquinone/menaquinone biosynthesis C-methylase UbiE
VGGDNFHEFEKAGWSERGVVDEYEHALSRLTAQSVPALLDAARVSRGTRFLDLATGPGHAAQAAADRGATVVAVDFSPEMVARARRRGVDAREGDATALPFADESFDAVVISFGMLHFADPDRVLAQARRVLAPEGRVAFTVWAAPERAIGLNIGRRAVEAHGDPNAAAALPVGPPFFRFSDPEECIRTLHRAGFAECRVSEVPQTWRLASADELIRGLTEGTVRNRALLRAQPTDSLSRIHAAMREMTRPYVQADGSLEIPTPAVLASAVRPARSV